MNKKEKIIKYILVMLLLLPIIFFVLIILDFLYGDKSPFDWYHIQEKLVVKYDSKWIDPNKNYLLDLNTWKFEEYNWDYLLYPCDKKDIIEKYYNNDKQYYIFCNLDKQRYIYESESWIWKKIDNFIEGYWSQDWKYLITLTPMNTKSNNKQSTININSTNVSWLQNLWEWNRIRVLWSDWIVWNEITDVLWYVLEE